MLAVALATAAAGAPWATAATSTFRAEPEVGVVELAANGSGSGAITLRNDGTTTVNVTAITATPGCDPAVRVPTGPFSVAAGATHPLSISCSPAPAGMQRCTFEVQSSSGVIAELEGVCAYAGTAGLTPDAPALDFGTVTVGGTTPHTIALQNTTATAFDQVFVETTDLAGNFAVGSPCNPDARECDAQVTSVRGGDTLDLSVACTPRGPGAHTAQLYLVTGGGTRLAAPISLSCTGAPAEVPVLSVAPAIVDVGAVEVLSAMAAATVHISNAGVDQLKLLDVQIVDGGTGAAADWTYSATAPCDAHIPPSCALDAGQTVDLDLVFDPGAIGVRDAILLVNFHDTADRSISIPLRGLGRGATLDLVGGETTSTIDFGTLPLATTGTLTFQVANNGTRDLTDGALSLTPAGPFTVSPGPTFSIAAATRTTFTVTCKPTTAGPATADLQLSAPDVASAPIALTLRCTGDPALQVFADPPALMLGEVRIGTQRLPSLRIMHVSAPVMLGAPTLEMASQDLMVSGGQAPTPATIDVTVAARAEGRIADRILVNPATGSQLAVPVNGAAVTAMYSVPGMISLGTFCVGQPTTARILPLASIGTATIEVMTPALQRSDSPFDLALIAPTRYPVQLAPLQSALVAVTPKRQAAVGVSTDDLIWATDVTDSPTAHTSVAATFIDKGGAIAPHDLEFGNAPIHLDTRNAQQVTLRNCDVSPLQLDPPMVPAPFTIDSPNFPTELSPGETATFSVGFHPTKSGSVTKTLVITSPQLSDTQLTVTLSGVGVAQGVNGDGGPGGAGLESTSFYACSGCASGDGSGAVMLLALVYALVPRRARGRRASVERG
ncbi:MAG TPA: choice-of-anchor D domain-containing protein [Kofleriaceae bacterium]|nr:choice-of-anchor D domain-containing protein [Kofleriaceae bacterium]